MKNTITRYDIDVLLARSRVDVCTKFDKVTIVTVQLPNGFVLIESSGAVDKANYSEELGRRTCLDRIAQRLWSFEGYRLAAAIASDVASVASAASELCYAIEQLPASEQQTAISVRASSIAQWLRTQAS